MSVVIAKPIDKPKDEKPEAKKKKGKE